MSAKKEALKYELYIAVSAERVWSALTDGVVTRRYFYGCDLVGELAKGSTLRYVADGVEMMRCKVLDVARNDRLVTTCEAVWDDKVKADRPSRLEWQITPMGPTTRLTLVHDELAASTATYEQSASGWPLILSGMKTVLETGKPLVVGS